MRNVLTPCVLIYLLKAGDCMKKYIFRDTDQDGRGFEEFDISGDAYIELIKTCAKYCTSFAFMSSNGEPTVIPEKLNDYKIPLTDEQVQRFSYCLTPYVQFCKETGDGEYVFAYRVCDESIELLLEMSSDLYGWYWQSEHTCPEDITFYREDGSVFFTSTTHDGICELTPREDEDVKNIVSKEHWL